MDKLNRSQQRPEGKLIESARKRTKPRAMSRHRAAELAGISESRWRQIETGLISPAAGLNLTTRGSADMLARMARVVGVTPDDLENVDRADAAEALREILAETEPKEQSVLERLTKLRDDLDAIIRDASIHALNGA